MKTLLAAPIMIGISAVSPVMAQLGNGWGFGSRYNRMYNPDTVQTTTGEVVSVDRFTPGAGMGQGCTSC
jgi:hypothetical protein